MCARAAAAPAGACQCDPATPCDAQFSLCARARAVRLAVREEEHDGPVGDLAGRAPLLVSRAGGGMMSFGGGSRALAAAAALLGTCPAWADTPSGFELINGYTLSDSEKCGDSDGKQLKNGRCGNLGGALKSGGAATCKGSASGYAACVKEAADACSGDPACFSFIVPSVGQPGTNWNTFAASVANAAPNKDWDVYYKPVRMSSQRVNAVSQRGYHSLALHACCWFKGFHAVFSVSWRRHRAAESAQRIPHAVDTALRAAHHCVGARRHDEIVLRPAYSRRMGKHSCCDMQNDWPHCRS